MNLTLTIILLALSFTFSSASDCRLDNSLSPMHSKLTIKYQHLLQDPTLIMTFPKDQRTEALSWIKEYQQQIESFHADQRSKVSNHSARQTILYEEGLKLLKTARENLSLFLDLKYREEEQIIALQLEKQRILIQQKTPRKIFLNVIDDIEEEIQWHRDQHTAYLQEHNNFLNQVQLLENTRK